MRYLRSSITVLVVSALLMTMAAPDVDHHSGFLTTPQTAAFVGDTHNNGGAPDNSNENKHHCLACPSSSQKIPSLTQQVFICALILFSFAFVPTPNHYIQVVDFHYSGKRSPPQV